MGVRCSRRGCPTSPVGRILAAEGNRAAGGSAPDASHSDFRAVLQMILCLAFVIAVAYAASLLLRRLNLGRLATRSGAVRVVETVPLGQGRAVHLLAVGDRRLLIGATPQGVTLLDEVTGQVEEIEAVPAPLPTPQTFLNHLQAFTRAGRGDKIETPAAQESPRDR